MDVDQTTLDHEGLEKDIMNRISQQLFHGCGRQPCNNRFCGSYYDTKLQQNDVDQKINHISQEIRPVIQNFKLDSTFSLSNVKQTPPFDRYFCKTPSFFDSNTFEKLQDFPNIGVQEKREFCHLLADIFRHPQFLNISFLLSPFQEATSNESGLNFQMIRETYQLLIQLSEQGHPAPLQSVIEGMGELLKVTPPKICSYSYLRHILILFENPLLIEFDYYEKITGPLFRRVNELVCSAHYLQPRQTFSPNPIIPSQSDQQPGVTTQNKINQENPIQKEEYKKSLVLWWSRLSELVFKKDITKVHQFVTLRVFSIDDLILHSDPLIISSVRVLELFYESNKLSPKLSYLEFYNEGINEVINLLDDFRSLKRGGFSFCNYPFILNADKKSKLLHLEATNQQAQLFQQAFLRRIFLQQQEFPFLMFDVDRQHLIRDTIIQLSNYPPEDYKKQLRVHFSGEEGIDEGGVKKEFFQLIVREIFDAKYGMFHHNPQNQTYYFNSSSFDFPEFELIGKILGLAIYNSIILDIHFPFVVWKKVMGVDPSFEDLKTVDPQLFEGLQKILAYQQDDMDEQFGINFQVSYDYFGEKRHHDLIPNAENVYVTQLNKYQYVELYYKYIISESVQEQFSNFERGLKLVCMGSCFEMLQPEELELLVCGSQQLDFHELESVTVYENGYHPNHPVIKNFWAFVHSLTLEEQKKLLFFTTGSDRAPIGGLSKIDFIIVRHGDDGARLPQAHTCFNHLLLPSYNTREQLEDRFRKAFNNAEGFGMQ